MNNSNQNPVPQNCPNGKGLSIAALVLGIIACVLAWFSVINTAGLICGIIGIVCAVKGRAQASAAGVGTGLGTAGMVLSIIGTAVAGIGFLSCTICTVVCGSCSSSLLM